MPHHLHLYAGSQLIQFYDEKETHTLKAPDSMHAVCFLLCLLGRHAHIQICTYFALGVRTTVSRLAAVPTVFGSRPTISVLRAAVGVPRTPSAVRIRATFSHLGSMMVPLIYELYIYNIIYIYTYRINS